MDLPELPDWLETPINYYDNLGTDLRLEIFKLITKDLTSRMNLEEVKLIKTVLNLLQLSNIMMDDITNDVKVRNGQKSMHEKHGVREVSIWALALSHYIYKIILDNFTPEETAMKYVQLYNDFGTKQIDPKEDSTEMFKSDALEKKLFGDDVADKKKRYDYRQLAIHNIATYVASFPFALYVLMRTRDLKKSMRVLEDDNLTEIGYLLLAETEFIGHFTEDNKNIDSKDWTILMDMLAKKMEADFEYPDSKAKASELFEKYDLYNEYIKIREDSIQSLKYEVQSMNLSQLKGVMGKTDIFNAKLTIIEHCLSYFETFKYKGDFKQVNNGLEGASSSKDESETK